MILNNLTERISSGMQSTDNTKHGILHINLFYKCAYMHLHVYAMTGNIVPYQGQSR